MWHDGVKWRHGSSVGRGYLILSVTEGNSGLNDWLEVKGGRGDQSSFYRWGNRPRDVAEPWPDTLISGSGQEFCPLASVRHHTNPGPPAYVSWCHPLQPGSPVCPLLMASVSALEATSRVCHIQQEPVKVTSVLPRQSDRMSLPFFKKKEQRSFLPLGKT